MKLTVTQCTKLLSTHYWGTEYSRLPIHLTMYKARDGALVTGLDLSPAPGLIFVDAEDSNSVKLR